MALTQKDREDIAAIVAESVAAAMVAAAPARSASSAEAATHWAKRDLPCLAGTCDKLFRSVTGQEYHRDHVHAVKA